IANVDEPVLTRPPVLDDADKLAGESGFACFVPKSGAGLVVHKGKVHSERGVQSVCPWRIGDRHIAEVTRSERVDFECPQAKDLWKIQLGLEEIRVPQVQKAERVSADDHAILGLDLQLHLLLTSRDCGAGRDLAARINERAKR